MSLHSSSGVWSCNWEVSCCNVNCSTNVIGVQELFSSPFCCGDGIPYLSVTLGKSVGQGRTGYFLGSVPVLF